MKRRRELIDSIKELRDVDSNYDQYKAKMNEIVNSQDMIRFSNEILLEPNLILSFVFDNRLFLQRIGIFDRWSFKLYALFISSMFHFCMFIMNDKECKEFLTKYFNFNDSCVGGFTLFGLETCGVSPKSAAFKGVSNIINSEYFKGVNDTTCNSLESVIRGCIGHYSNKSLHGLQLMLNKNNIVKNKEIIVKGMNYKDSYSNNQHWLSILLQKPFCDKTWLNLLLFDTLDIQKQEKVFIEKEELQNGLKVCQGFEDEDKKQEWSKIIHQYAKEINQTLD